jgi:hypothetical protein
MRMLVRVKQTAGVVLFTLALVVATSIGHVGRVSAQVDEAAALKERAVKLFDERRYTNGEPLFRNLLEMLEKLYGSGHRYVASSLLYLASGQATGAVAPVAWRVAGRSGALHRLEPRRAFIPCSTAHADGSGPRLGYRAAAQGWSTRQDEPT